MCPQLENVDLSNSVDAMRFTDRQMRRMQLTDSAAEYLSTCSELKYVNLSQRDSQFTDAAAEHLAKCAKLQTVEFSGCRNLTDAAARHLAECPKLVPRFQHHKNRPWIQMATRRLITPRVRKHPWRLAARVPEPTAQQ